MIRFVREFLNVCKKLRVLIDVVLKYQQRQSGYVCLFKDELVSTCIENIIAVNKVHVMMQEIFPPTLFRIEHDNKISSVLLIVDVFHTCDYRSISCIINLQTDPVLRFKYQLIHPLGKALVVLQIYARYIIVLSFFRSYGQQKCDRIVVKLQQAI